MDAGSSLALGVTALTLGLIHTLIGPDHYVPFVALAKPGRWSLRKTLVITSLCGLGHVLSSVVIGLIGIAAGLALASVEGIEETRGAIATWLLMGFGLAYGAWGLWRGLRGRPHSHPHSHEDGINHDHEHAHEVDHIHPHGEGRLVWILFIIFAFGPCEPLVPLLMYPAASRDWFTLVMVTCVFGTATIGTMLVMVALGWHGVRILRLGIMERYVHALAGGVLALSGAVVLLFDL